MELAALIYFIDVICGGHAGLAVLTCFITSAWLFGFVVSIVIQLNEDIKHEDSQKFLSVYRSMWPLKTFVIITITLSVVLPNKDTAYKMLAAYGVQTIIENPDVQKLGGKSLEVLNKAMDEYLQEGKSATPVSPEKVEK